MENNLSQTKDIELPLLDHKGKEISKHKKKSYFVEQLSRKSHPDKYNKKASWLKILTFVDILPFMRNARSLKRPLEKKDLPLPYDFLNIERKILELDSFWVDEKNNANPSLVRALFRTFKTEMTVALTLGGVFCIGSILIKLTYGDIIASVTKGNLGGSNEYDEAWNSAIIISVMLTILVFLDNWYWTFCMTNGVRIRNTILGFTYKKLQSIALHSLHTLNVGKVINLLSNDLNDIDRNFGFVTPALFTPFSLLISFFIIWNYFGVYSFICMIGLFFFFWLSVYLSNKTEKPRIDKNALTDERIKLTHELVESIRLLKMYAWEKAFKQIIVTIRSKEAKKFLLIKLIECTGETFALNSPYFCIYILCVVYTLQGGVLTPEKVYATLMVLNFIRIWSIYFFHIGRMFFVSFRVMRSRIEEILNIEDVLSIQDIKTSNQFSIMGSTASKNKPISIIYKNYNAWWNPTDPKPSLSDINIQLEPGKVTALIGKIGSGKTTFLLSLLKEIPKEEGELKVSGSIAYVEQEPIIFSGTVKTNILFGLPMRKEFYNQCILASNLDADLQQFKEGDETVIGERGITLSGGQKARISLARALYSDSDIYLLDDPLSAVDSKVGRHIFENAIRGSILKKKIVILVTHHIDFAKDADEVLLFDGGRIQARGSIESLSKLNIDLLNIFKSQNEAPQKKKSDASDDGLKDTPLPNMRKQSSKFSSHVGEDESAHEAEENKAKSHEETEVKVTFQTYKKYLLEANKAWALLFLLFLYFLSALLAIFLGQFMGVWALACQKFYNGMNPDYDNSYYILWSGLLTLSLPLVECSKFMMTNKVLLDSNTGIHAKMMENIIRAVVSFFDITPIGNCVNRFSSDLGVCDKGNPQLYLDTFDGFVAIFTMLGYLVMIDPLIMLPCVVMVIMLWNLRQIFAWTVMELKRLDASSRSPIFSEISSTIGGLTIIRAFRQGGAFVRNFCDLIYENLQAYSYMERVQRTFAYSMNLTLLILNIVGTFLLVYLAFGVNLEAGIFGMSLNVLLELAGYCSWCVRMTLLLDINMQSAERMIRYTNLPKEAPDHIPERDEAVVENSHGKWPYKGEIVFSNVYMKYRPELDYVLKGVSFRISTGMKVGVVGRTGAGKSSLIQALFRLTEIERIPGTSIVIDGVDLRTIGLDLLRRSISIIPQTPVIFTGSIKRNLDPFGEYSEMELWDVLEEVTLRTYVESLEKKLDTDMTVSNSVFSTGQKQLVCLARAILKKSKIILLDEATANVDIETDQFIQKTIMNKFENCTVLTIAHRLITIANYDKVLVLDKGAVAEFDHPYKLLVNDVNDRNVTNRETLFAKMVLKTEDTMVRSILDVARKKFFSQNKL